MKVACGTFNAVGNVTSPVTLYTPTADGLFRVTIYAEDITRLQGAFQAINPAISYTSPSGADIVGTAFGNQNSSWAGSDTEIVNSVASDPISFTCVNNNSTDTISFYYIVESL